MARRWADVAELIETQGLKGRLVARSVRGLPFLLNEGMPVDFVPPTLDGPRHAEITCIQHLGGQDYLVEFSGVADRSQAEMLAGSHCLVARELLPDDFDELVSGRAEEVGGYAVVDDKLGEMGPVVEVREMPTQDLLVVDYGGEEVLIPFVEEFVRDVDSDAGIVRVSLPADLIALNA